MDKVVIIEGSEEKGLDDNSARSHCSRGWCPKLWGGYVQPQHPAWALCHGHHAGHTVERVPTGPKHTVSFQDARRKPGWDLAASLNHSPPPPRLVCFPTKRARHRDASALPAPAAAPSASAPPRRPHYTPPRPAPLCHRPPKRSRASRLTPTTASRPLPRRRSGAAGKAQAGSVVIKYNKRKLKLLLSC